VRDHLLFDCAQLGAGHEVSNRSTAKVEAAHATVEALMGCGPAGGGGGAVALGPSTSQLLANLGACFARLLGPGDEVIVQEACHEANSGPWLRCAGAAARPLRLRVGGGGGGRGGRRRVVWGDPLNLLAPTLARPPPAHAPGTRSRVGRGPQVVARRYGARVCRVGRRRRL
jgi:hypothetical protein